MRLALAALGFCSTLAQLLLMREFVATFYGNELLFGLALMAWLAWVAVGSWGLARLAQRQAHGRGVYASGLILAGGILLGQMALIRGARRLLGVTSGAFVEFVPMVALVVLSLAPLCVLAGFLFTLGARLSVERGGTAGRAYAWESAGALVGGALFSFVFIRWLEPFQTALLVAGVAAAVAVALLVSPMRRRISRFGLPLLPLGALVLAALPIGGALQEATLRWEWKDLAYAADSPYGRLTIEARDGQRAFFVNGLLAFETQGTFAEEVAHLPLLQHPQPKRVLLIGGGVAGDLHQVLMHPVEAVTYVELDPLILQAAREQLPAQEAAVLDDPRVAPVLSDGRRFVQGLARQDQSATGGSFNVIILDLPEPSTGTLNRFYTLEFFEEVAGILEPGGVFALGLPSAENYWSPELARRNGSVYHTLRSVFGEVMVLPGEHNFYLASDLPLQSDPQVLAGRLAERRLETRWVTPPYLEYLFTTDRFAAVRRELEATQGVRLNRDLSPICYYYDLALWLSRVYPNLRPLFERASLVNLWWVAIPIAGLVALARWRRRWSVPLVVGGVGLAGMTLELVILFGFQVTHGYLYAQVSLIVTAFMAGLALGAAAADRMAAGWRARSNAAARRGAGGSGRADAGDGMGAGGSDRADAMARISVEESNRADAEARIGAEGSRRADATARRGLIAVLLGFLLLGAAPLLLAPLRAPALAYPALALLAGALGGASFPLAMLLTPGRGARAVGLLYGMDLLGGCLGALLGAAFFVPLLGIPQTCAVVGLVGVAGVAVLWQ